MYSQEIVTDSVLFSITVAGLRAFNLRKRETILDVFCEICEVLQTLIFTEDNWTAASDFQQQFGYITCSNYNKSTYSLSWTFTMSCSQAIHSVCLQNI